MITLLFNKNIRIFYRLLSYLCTHHLLLVLSGVTVTIIVINSNTNIMHLLDLVSSTQCPYQISLTCEMEIFS